MVLLWLLLNELNNFLFCFVVWYVISVSVFVFVLLYLMMLKWVLFELFLWLNKLVKGINFCLSALFMKNVWFVMSVVVFLNFFSVGIFMLCCVNCFFILCVNVW